MNSLSIATAHARFWVCLLFLSALSILSGCSGVRWISDYDETTDKSLVALQQRADEFIASLKKNFGSAAASLKSSEGSYEDIDRDLRRLEFRVGSIPKNSKTEALVKNIRLAILGEGKGPEGASLKDLHSIPENAQRGISPRTLEVARRNIDQAISAALSLELAKKQGLEQNK